MVSGRVETESEVKETRGKVDEGRKHEMDAAIVRVMKARKHLSHNDLFLQVSDQLKLRFLPDPLLMKKRVESLIERDFISRDEDDNKKYKYLA